MDKNLDIKAEVNMSPKHEYFCTTSKNGTAQECGSTAGHMVIFMHRKSYISALIKKMHFFCIVE